MNKRFLNKKVNVENGNNAFDRLVDSEAKIIEDITHKLGYDKIGVDETVEGSVVLLTERVPCRSCQYVLDQFQQMFPNVNVVVVYVYRTVDGLVRVVDRVFMEVEEWFINMRCILQMSIWKKLLQICNSIEFEI